MLDRLEKLSDLRDQGLTFYLEANPHTTSYRDQGYLQASEWTGDSYIPREVIYVGPTDRCRELLYQLEAGEITARQVRELDQTEPRELEALYLLDDATYLHIQLRDEGYDYTLYDKETMRHLDGGVIDLEDVARSPIKHPLPAVREEIFDAMGERPEKVEDAPLELVEKLQEAQLEPPENPYLEQLREHFEQEDAALWDTKLDTYPMPDPSLSMEDLFQAGYTEDDLLPVSQDTAAHLYDGDFTVYLIHPGENPELVFDETDFDPHDGLFAIPRRNGRPARTLTTPSRAVSGRRNSRSGRPRSWTTRGIALPSTSSAGDRICGTSAISPWSGCGLRGNPPGRATMIWSTPPRLPARGIPSSSSISFGSSSPMLTRRITSAPA